MRYIKYILLTLLISVATGVEAKQIKTPHMYMFGFAASFKDSVVYITEIQDVQGAWYETKSHTLYGLDNYSSQLKTHLPLRHSTLDVPSVGHTVSDAPQASTVSSTHRIRSPSPLI